MGYYNYKIIDIVEAGHHSFSVENEDGMVFARGEGSSFLQALDNLRRAIPPTTRYYGKNDNFWISPLDEEEEDYD